MICNKAGNELMCWCSYILVLLILLCFSYFYIILFFFNFCCLCLCSSEYILSRFQLLYFLHIFSCLLAQFTIQLFKILVKFCDRPIAVGDKISINTNSKNFILDDLLNININEKLNCSLHLDKFRNFTILCPIKALLTITTTKVLQNLINLTKN